MSGVAPWPPRSPCWTACIAAWPWWRVVCCAFIARAQPGMDDEPASLRSEEHTSELQSLMRISYAVFCLKKKTKNSIGMAEKRQERVPMIIHLFRHKKFNCEIKIHNQYR